MSPCGMRDCKQFLISAESALIKIFLKRSSSPLRIEISDFAMFSFFASQLMSSWLAFPFSGILTTLIFKKLSPSGVVNIPNTLQQEELGVNLTLKIMPPSTGLKNKSAYQQNTQTRN